jgi:TonB-dependent receptor
MTHSLISRRKSRAPSFAALAAALAFCLPLTSFARTQPGTETEAEAGDEAAAADAEADEQAEKDAEKEAAAAAAEGEAELAAEEARAAGAITRPPPAGKGVVWGVVKDTKFSESVIEAQVSVIGRKEKTFTDVEGRYRLELPPGKYKIRVAFELHQPSRIDDVIVVAGKISRIDVKLVPDESAVEEVVIEESVDTQTTEGVALTRKNAAAAGDGVGRAEIARTPDKNAAEAAQRVVGATVVGGRFVFVRGLGERYTNALLNGAPLPSPEPDRNTVPLDLFPSMVLDSLTIAKQFTPDMPGDFAGGSVRIQTRDFPKQALLQIALSGAFNSAATFQKRPSYYGSSTQWLGYDGGRRDFPPGIPNQRLSGANYSNEELVQYGYRFNTLMSTMRRGTPPNHGLTIVAGNGWKVGANKKAGVLLALSYSRTYQLRDIVARKYQLQTTDGQPNLLVVDEDYAGTQGIDSVRIGAFGNASLEINRQHTISLLGLRSQTADDATSELEGTLRSSGSRVHTSHLEYVARRLSFVQVRGEHRYPKQNDLQINWHASIAKAQRDQPDTRDVRYAKATRDGAAGWSALGDGNGLHSWYDQSDRTLAAGLDVQQPIVKGAHDTKLKLGGLLSSRDRAFKARRFQLQAARSTGPLFDAASFCYGEQWSTNCASQLFRPDLVRTDGLVLDEWTFNLDQYSTSLDIYSLYGMVDTKLTSQLRAVAGVRPEITSQYFIGYDPFKREDGPRTSTIFETTWLPALSLVYAVGKESNFRFGASRTVARPQLREITPTRFTSFSGDADVQGNERLQLTKIANFDLRFETFPTLREVLAISLFYKNFSKPIEEVIGNNNLLSFANAEGGYALGLELEGRKSLDWLAPALKPFTFIGNLTLVKSRVDLGANAAQSTNSERSLSFQSPYVVNLSLDYDNEKSRTEFRILYNVFGPRIVAAGSEGLPDIYELPRHSLDLSVAQKIRTHFELKLQAQNILGGKVVYANRDVQAFRQQLDGSGVQSFQSLGNSPVVRSYTLGTVIALTGTYNY